MRAPKKIDLVAIQKAANCAGYTIETLEVEVVGQAAKANCKDCKKETDHLRVEKTGQLLELSGKLPAGRRLRVQLAGSGWGKESFGFFTPKTHAPLGVKKFEDAPSPEKPAPQKDAAESATESKEAPAD